MNSEEPGRWVGAARAAWHVAGPVAVTSGALVWRGLKLVLVPLANILAALVIAFEEWGWRPLERAIARLARYRLWARMERAIAGLPPYGALVIFALPTTILFPLKIVALWLLAEGHAITAGALLAFAKIASTALIARIFLLTKPALMQIGWFARAYHWFMPWKEHLLTKIRASWPWRYGRIFKARAKRWLNGAALAARPYLRRAAETYRSWSAVMVERLHRAGTSMRQVLDRLRQRLQPP